MIQSVKVTNPKGESLVLDLFNPYESGIYVKEITGIGGLKADIHTSSLSVMDGSVYNSSRAPERNIVIRVGYLGSPTIEESRQKIYRYFPSKKRVVLLFTTEFRTAEIIGYVEDNSSPIFSEDETGSISIICPDPYFYAPGIESQAFLGVDPGFEFPFSNESLTEPLLEFGQLRLDTRAVLVYTGDADTGIQINIRSYEDGVKNIRINNLTTQEYMLIDTDKIQRITGYAFGKNDSIIVSTINQQKSIFLHKNGKSYNIIGAVNKDAAWFQLSAGDNVFDFSCEAGEKDIMLTFIYRNAYGGI